MRLELAFFKRQGNGEHEAAEYPDQAKIEGKRNGGEMLTDTFCRKRTRSAVINIQAGGDQQNAERDNKQTQHNAVRKMDALDGCL